MRAALLLLLAVAPAARAPGQAPPAPAPEVVQGRVADVLGEPIPAAEVRALVHGKVAARTHTDGEGLYHLRVPAARADLRFAAPGKVEARVPWRTAPGPAVRNVVLEDGATLRGRVVDARGAGVAHAAVLAVGGGCTALTAVTAADGGYELRGVPLRPLLVRALCESGWTETSVRVLGDQVLDLAIQDHERLSLVEVHGLPAGAHERASVRVYGPDVAAVVGDGHLTLGADGTAALLLQEYCLLEVTAPGLTVAPATMVASPRQRRYRFTVTGPAEAHVQAAATLRGTVRTVGDRFVAGVRLLVRDRSHRDLGSATSGVDGAFRLRIEHPPDGFVRIAVASDAWVLDHDDATTADGTVWQPAYVGGETEVVVDRASEIRGALPPARGNAFALAEVAVFAADAVGHGRPLRTHTDFAGGLRLALPQGEHDVVVVGHDGTVWRARIVAAAGRDPAIAWEPLATGAIAGVLCDADGRPLPGVELVARADVMRTGRDRWPMRTDRKGRFRCRGLPTGEWQLTAGSEAAGEPVMVTVVAGQETPLELGGAR